MVAAAKNNKRKSGGNNRSTGTNRKFKGNMGRGNGLFNINSRTSAIIQPGNCQIPPASGNGFIDFNEPTVIESNPIVKKNRFRGGGGANEKQLQRNQNNRSSGNDHNRSSKNKNNKHQQQQQRNQRNSNQMQPRHNRNFSRMSPPPVGIGLGGPPRFGVPPLPPFGHPMPGPSMMRGRPLPPGPPMMGPNPLMNLRNGPMPPAPLPIVMGCGVGPMRRGKNIQNNRQNNKKRSGTKAAGSTGGGKSRNNKKESTVSNKKTLKEILNQYPLDKPWVSEAITAECKLKEDIENRLRGQGKNDELFKEFKIQRDKFVSMYEQAKKEYEEKGAEKGNNENESDKAEIKT